VSETSPPPPSDGSAQAFVTADDEPLSWYANGLWVILLSYVVLLPVEPWFNAPLLVMALVGVYLVFKLRQRLVLLREFRLFSCLFLCIWLPMLIATIDAVNFTESARKTASFLVAYPLGVFVLWSTCSETVLRRLMLGLFAVLSVWLVDALVQLGLGRGLFGYPYDTVRLSGVFYPKFTLGVVLATLSPLYFDVVRRLCRRTGWAALALLPFVLIIVLSGSRSSWSIFFFATVGYLFYLWKWSGSSLPSARIAVRCLAVVLLIGLATSLLFPSMTDTVKSVASNRFDRTVQLFAGDRESIDKALARRLSLWETAANIVEVHWLNGIGPRGYRYVYPDFAPDHDFFQKGALKGNPTHPHQVVLEIATETGLIGVVGYLMFIVLVLKKLRGLGTAHLTIVFPAALALVLSIFPLNVHKAFYGNMSSSLMWWLLLVFMVALKSVDYPGYGRTTPSSPGVTSTIEGSPGRRRSLEN